MLINRNSTFSHFITVVLGQTEHMTEQMRDAMLGVVQEVSNVHLRRIKHEFNLTSIDLFLYDECTDL